jgi:chemotaxis protein CheC
MDELNHIETDVAKEIINIGLGKAADSLSFFSQQKVIIRSSELMLKNTSEAKKLSKKEGNSIHVLTTDIVGELKGVCFLIFNEKEVNKLLKISLPASILEDEEQKLVMSDAILKEADNIISASVITQFSNLLKFNIHGSVPEMDIMSEEKVMPFLLSRATDTKYFLQISAQFHTEEVDFSPEFVWFLDAKFIEGIKKFVKDEKYLDKLKEHTGS